MLTSQPVLGQRPTRLKGRSQRTQSIGTKLTLQEVNHVLAAAESAGKVPSEWVRDVLLRELRPLTATEPFLAEVLGVRLLLVNVLRPLILGQKMSPESFDKLLDDIGTKKYELAAKLLAGKGR